jgi:hypothetical protein
MKNQIFVPKTSTKDPTGKLRTLPGRLLIRRQTTYSHMLGQMKTLRKNIVMRIQKSGEKLKKDLQRRQTK